MHLAQYLSIQYTVVIVIHIITTITTVTIMASQGELLYSSN